MESKRRLIWPLNTRPVGGRSTSASAAKTRRMFVTQLKSIKRFKIICFVQVIEVATFLNCIEMSNITKSVGAGKFSGYGPCRLKILQVT